MKYNVSVFCNVRVAVRDIEAESHEEAMKKADEFDFHAVIDRGDVEYTETVEGYLVDEAGDTEYENSVWYDHEYRPL